MQPTILIVDDEKHTRDGLRRLLEDEYDVYVAEDIAARWTCSNAKQSTCC